MPFQNYSMLLQPGASLSAELIPYTLRFKQPATTSRNTMQEHSIWYLALASNKVQGRIGWGEVAPLKGLSRDLTSSYEAQLKLSLELLQEGVSLRELPLEDQPALRFGLETALLDLVTPVSGMLFQNDYTQGKAALPINGLVWMNDAVTMYAEAINKIAAGYTCIKFKVGALDFDEECRMLERIRKQFNAFKVTLRLDANGAFQPDEALEKLKELSRFDIHSIEQPLRQGQPEWMEAICRQSRIPIALDEELIYLSVAEAPAWLKKVQPAFLVIKPTLVGGLEQTAEWIRIADQQGMGWWVTSALESNLGLNAIAQFTADYPVQIPQGLGTGALYVNNPGAGLKSEAGCLSGILDKEQFERDLAAYRTA